MSQTSQPGRIFISYRREDSAYATGWLYDRLRERFGVGQIFKDVDSLEPGDDFVDKITEAVSSCAVLLAVIGPDWLRIADESGRPRLHDDADFVRLELEVALARQVRVIPLLVEGASMPRAEQLPKTLTPLLRRHALELTSGHFNRDADDLLVVLHKAVGAAPAAVPFLDHVDVAPAPAPAPRPAPDPAPAPQPAVHEPAVEDAASTALWDDRFPPWETFPEETVTRPRPPLLGWMRRRLALLLLVAALLAAVVGGIVYLNVPVPRSVLPLAEDVLLWPATTGNVSQVVRTEIDQPDLQEPLTPGSDSGITISRDRRSVLFLRDRPGAPRELWVMAASGQRARSLLADNPDTCPRLHRAAWWESKIAVVCTDSVDSPKGSLRLFSVRGEVLGDPVDQGVLGDPTFCDGGESVVYWRNDSTSDKPPDGGALYRKRLDRDGDPERLTDGRSGQDADPTCSPQSDRLLFRRTIDKVPGISSISLGAGLGDDPQRLTPAGQPARDPAWSPDGEQIAFRQGPASNADLWVMRADGASPQVLVARAGNDGAPAWTSR